MLVKQLGAIEKILLPPDYALGAEEFGSRGDNWARTYYPGAARDVEIVFLYRGRASTEKETALLRSFLQEQDTSKDTPKGILSDTTGGDSLKAQQLEEQAIELEWILDVIGDNQFTRKTSGLTGPGFFLSGLYRALVSSRPILHAFGYFHNNDGQPANYYHGIFFDGTPLNKRAQIEEVFLQSTVKQTFDAHLAPFERCLATIQWIQS